MLSLLRSKSPVTRVAAIAAAASPVYTLRFYAAALGVGDPASWMPVNAFTAGVTGFFTGLFVWLLVELAQARRSSLTAKPAGLHVPSHS